MFIWRSQRQLSRHDSDAGRGTWADTHLAQPEAHMQAHIQYGGMSVWDRNGVGGREIGRRYRMW